MTTTVTGVAGPTPHVAKNSNQFNLLGTGFTDATSVTIDGDEVAEFNEVPGFIDTALQVIATNIPAGTFDVVVTSPSGASAPFSMTWEAAEPPTIVYMTPTEGTPGTVVTVTVENLFDGEFTVDGLTAISTVTINGAFNGTWSEVTFIVPDGTPGLVNVVLETLPLGVSAGTDTTTFTIIAAPAVPEGPWSLEPVVEFGLDATGPNDPFFTWTRRGDARTDQGIETNKGRTADSPSVTAGAASLTLDNLDGQYDTMVRTGTPVRVRARLTETSPTAGVPYGSRVYGGLVYGGAGEAVTTRTVWTGSVDGRPSATSLNVDHTVDVEALDAIGLASQTDGVATAWDALMAEFTPQPEVWWRPGVDSWIDKLTGTPARHTAVLDETDPLIFGEDRSWHTPEGEGRGVVDGGPFIDTAPGQGFAISMWVRLDQPPTSDRLVTLLHQLDEFGLTQIKVQIKPSTRQALITLANTYGGWIWYSPIDERIGLLDGRAHHLMIDGGFDIEVDGVEKVFWARMFVDGREVRLNTYEDSMVVATGIPGDRMYLAGGARPTGGADPVLNATGAVDHIQFWNDHPWHDTRGHVPEIAALLSTTGHRAWAGDRMNVRLQRILDAAGMTAVTGALDESTVVAVDGYTTDSMLGLFQQIEDTEQGRVWCDQDGMIRMARRGWAWGDTTATEVQAWFSDDPADIADGALPMLADGLQINDDPRSIVNQCDVTSMNGRTQTVEDTASIVAYGRRNPLSIDSLLHGSDMFSLAIAQWQILSRSTPQVRIDRLRFPAHKTLGCARLLGTLDEGHLVKVTHRGVHRFAHVAGIRYEIGDHEWVGILDLDGTRTGYEWFRADTSDTDGTDGAAF